MAKQPKLKTLLEDIFNEQPQVNKFEVVEGVKSFNIVGKSLYNNSNILEVAKQYVDEDENGKKIIASHWDGGEAASWNVNYRQVTAIIKLLINQKDQKGE